MANDETTASKRPSGGSGSARSCSASSMRASSAKRSRCPEHQLGEVDSHAGHLGTIGLQEGEQTPVARAEVEHATNPPRHVLEQNALSLQPVRELVRAGEVALDVLLIGCPLFPLDAAIIDLSPAGCTASGQLRVYRSRRNGLIVRFRLCYAWAPLSNRDIGLIPILPCLQ